MAKKRTTGKLSAGTRIRVKSGVSAPEFPDVPCEGWTGSVSELIGKKAAPKYVVEWDNATIGKMPAAYREQCEQKGLFYRMSCFSGEELEAVDA